MYFLQFIQYCLVLFTNRLLKLFVFLHDKRIYCLFTYHDDGHDESVETSSIDLIYFSILTKECVVDVSFQYRYK